MRLLLLLLLSVGLVHAEEFNAKVIAVMDGDTIMVLRNNEKIKIRLANIDAPEKAQKFGMESRQALVDRVLKKQVHVNSLAMDNYGRMVAGISIDGRSVNEEQVRSGMAWEYSHFHSNKHYLALQSEAQQARRGLWAQSASPVQPELWRKSHPASTSGSAAQPARRYAACGIKHLCSQMSSCEEARFYFSLCGIKSLDGDGDGVPCESLCGAGRIEYRR